MKARPAPGRRRPGLRALLGISVGLFLLAFGLRAVAIVRSYDLFIDEITYTNIARNLATGHGLTLYGAPFNLHPPAVFAIFAAVVKLFHLNGGVADVAYQLRLVSAVFGSLAVVGAYLLLRLARVPLSIALVGAVVLAIEPFQISFDSRVMLEAPTQLFALATVLLLGVLGERPRISRRRTLIGLAGLTGALTLCGKETFGLVLALTLILLGVTRWAGRRRDAFAVLGLSAAGYAAATVAVWLTTGFRPWWSAHLSGLDRLIGTRQDTGFNAPTTQVSLASRVLANLTDYAVTYAILLAGGLSVLVLLVSRFRRRSFFVEPGARAGMAVALWGLASCLYLCYATVIGSLEEQMYYITLLPCLLALLLVVTRITRRRRVVVRWLITAVALVGLAVDTGVWFTVHTYDNNTYRQFMSWEQKHVPKGSTVAVTEDAAQFLITNADPGLWATPAALKAHHVDYAVLQTGLVKQGYGIARPVFLTYLEQHTPVVFRSTMTRDGQLVVFDVRGLTGGSRR